MISVLNHRRRLNGNSTILFFVLLLFSLSACRTTKVATRAPIKKKPPISVVNEKPKKDTIVSVITKVDTVVTDVVKDPINTHKRIGKLGVILPVDAANILVSKTRMKSRDESMMHYALGVKLALQELERQGKNMEVFIRDSGRKGAHLDQILDQFKDNKVEFLFGGKGTDEVTSIANFAAEHKINYCAPWQKNSEFIGTNDKYLQFSPGLETHIYKMLTMALKEHDASEIIIYSMMKHKSRVDMINEMYKELTGATENLDTLLINTKEELHDLELEEMMESEEEYVFLMTATGDFNLIHDMIRALQINELASRSVIYGITDWNSPKLFNQLNSFDIRLTSMYDNVIDRRYSQFEEDFYQEIHVLPNDFAYQAYNHILLTAGIIEKLNAEESIENMHVQSPGMTLTIKDYNSTLNPGLDLGRSYQSSYYVNTDLFLLGFKDFKYFIRD